MGALYLAATGDRGLEKLLVIKTVIPHLADKEYVARFRDEAKVVVKLSHGNLIPVFDAGQVEGELFLAMDFVEGKDLRAVWNRCAKKAVAFPVDVAVFIIKELCRGLAYAHGFEDLELVHRDVSPPNVLISYSGEVKLTDFGLAASTIKVEKTAPGIIYGKVAYMSPEQARGEKLDGRSDQYAAAIILWELLTGRQLFPPSSDQPQDLVKRARCPEVLAPSKRAPRVPPSLDAICLRALSGTREDRYPDCEAFREALAGWLAKEAPGTDAARLESFVSELFREDIDGERAERGSLLKQIRERVRTLPPTDELRQWVEKSAATGAASANSPAGGSKVRAPGSVGRRATDVEGPPGDRRQGGDRRRNGRGATHEETERGVIVDVPKPRRDGRTVPTPPPTASQMAQAAAASAAEIDPDAAHQTSPAQMIGQVIDGRYRIDQLLGEGGMGRVYLAEHVEIGKRVGVKILHEVYGRMPDLVERFRREARAASRIGHPHIVDVTDSGTTEDGAVYFVMEYLEGVELADVIDREGALDVARTLRIAAQITRALAAAHAVGIIHRDLKPENVFLTMRSGVSDFVKVLDFGIAKSTEAEQARDKRLTSPGMAMGTPEYMAPEQAAGRPADQRCDIYSLGAILYEALTGRPPYEGENFMEILTKKATLDPPLAQSVRPEIPEVVGNLVARIMARDPDDRPQSMEAVEYELTKCLSGRGTAVAQILGMSSDPALVASLNPGLNVQLEEQGLASIRPERTATPARGLTPPGTTSAGVRTPKPKTPPSGEAPVAIDSGDDLDVGDNTASVLRPRARVGVLGWLALIALVGTGIGVIFFVASGERARKAPPTAAVGDGAEAPGPGERAPIATAPAAPDAAAAGFDLAAADAAPLDDGADDEEVEDAGADTQPNARPTRRVAKKPKTHLKKPRPPANSGPPRNKDEAETLLREADGHLSKLEWEAARSLYARVASGKHLKARGLLGLSKVAFETKDLDASIRRAKAAVKAGGGNAARNQLGYSYFKKGRYADALRVCEEVLKRNPGDKQARHIADLARSKLGQ